MWSCRQRLPGAESAEARATPARNHPQPSLPALGENRTATCRTLLGELSVRRCVCTVSILWVVRESVCLYSQYFVRCFCTVSILWVVSVLVCLYSQYFVSCQHVGVFVQSVFCVLSVCLCSRYSLSCQCVCVRSLLCELPVCWCVCAINILWVVSVLVCLCNQYSLSCHCVGVSVRSVFRVVSVLVCLYNHYSVSCWDVSVQSLFC